MTEKQINISVDDGTEFFAHEMSANFNPTQFTFDFRSVTPRVDPRTQETPLIAIKHNIIMVDPWHAKDILRVLSNIIGKYEKQYGEIKKPEAVKKYEAQAKEERKTQNVEKTQTPSYLG